MMRALILLLALLLPLQMSWAAMGTYCQAESETTSPHLAHHEHTAGKAQKSTSTPSNEGDIDCSLCHFSCIKSIQLHSTGVATPVVDALQTSPSSSRHPASHVAEGPDKPNWLLAA